jgi:hypothetical protein
MATPPRKMSAPKKAAALGSFLFLGLSPTYIDWQDKPQRRPQIVAYYGVALTLFWYGLLSG